MTNAPDIVIHEETSAAIATPPNEQAVVEGAEQPRTPLPKFQLGLVMLIQFAEPITALVIYPFINQFVQATGVTGGDDRKTGYYAGIIVSGATSYDPTRSLFTPTLRNRLSFLLKPPPSFTGVVCPIALAEDLC